MDIQDFSSLDKVMFFEFPCKTVQLAKCKHEYKNDYKATYYAKVIQASVLIERTYPIFH